MSSTALSELKESIQAAIKYVYSCQTEDSGYFFARVPPSSLQDTFFAAEILRILEHTPHQLEATVKFILSFQHEYKAQNIHALYLATGALLALGKPIETFRNYGQSAFENFKIHRFNRFANLDVEVVSELKAIFEALSLFLRFDFPVDKDSITDCILSLANEDGGYGYLGYSTLATTYYAVRTLDLMKRFPKKPETILAFLERKEKGIFFIEDLYYLMTTRSLLGENPWFNGREQAISFLLGYRRANGGFARGRVMGIPTLEYTCYAVSLLKLLKALDEVRAENVW